jgi:hypothetical protein
MGFKLAALFGDQDFLSRWAFLPEKLQTPSQVTDPPPITASSQMTLPPTEPVAERDERDTLPSKEDPQDLAGPQGLGKAALPTALPPSAPPQKGNDWVLAAVASEEMAATLLAEPEGKKAQADLDDDCNGDDDGVEVADVGGKA